VLVLLCGMAALAAAQTPGAAKPVPAATPPTISGAPVPSPQPTASPVSTPFNGPTLPVAPLNPGNTQIAPPVVPANSSTQIVNPLTLDDALRLANAQASAFQQAGLNEKIAAEDVKQAQAAFLPRVSAATDYIYTSPLIGGTPGIPREPSFIANNAVNEYQALLNVAGDADLSGKLRATLAKNRALLAAAHAGTEVARRALAQAVLESYYGLALASAQRRAAEQNLAAAEELEHVTSLLLSGGEVAPVDLTRAQLQTTARRDELEKARASEAVAAGSLRVLVGYDFLTPITTSDLTIAIPVNDEINRLTADMISTRPEFAQ
jgi:outer membrane protein TolC